jgi:hypothetical protein
VLAEILQTIAPEQKPPVTLGRLSQLGTSSTGSREADRTSFLINASVPVGAGSQSTDVCARFCFRPQGEAWRGVTDGSASSAMERERVSGPALPPSAATWLLSFHLGSVAIAIDTLALVAQREPAPAWRTLSKC